MLVILMGAAPTAGGIEYWEVLASEGCGSMVVMVVSADETLVQ
jgi:hypothetical protein